MECPPRAVIGVSSPVILKCPTLLCATTSPTSTVGPSRPLHWKLVFCTTALLFNNLLCAYNRSDKGESFEKPYPPLTFLFYERLRQRIVGKNQSRSAKNSRPAEECSQHPLSSSCPCSMVLQVHDMRRSRNVLRSTSTFAQRAWLARCQKFSCHFSWTVAKFWIWNLKFSLHLSISSYRFVLENEMLHCASFLIS